MSIYMFLCDRKNWGMTHDMCRFVINNVLRSHLMDVLIKMWFPQITLMMTNHYDFDISVVTVKPIFLFEVTVDNEN